MDSSRPALEVADHNAALNGREIEWIEANAFDLLRDYADAGTQYDTIVLDPPAFAKSKSNLETALRGYKELNLRALKMLRPAGSWSPVPAPITSARPNTCEVVASFGPRCPQKSSYLENRGQAKDHPILLERAGNRLPQVRYCLRK